MQLSEPLTLGPSRARNRIMFGPHETNLGRDRSFSDRHVAYYRRRAAGGAGIVVTEEASVHPSDWPYERAPLAGLCEAGWGQIAAACHDEGALVIAALGHSGGQGTSHWSQRELWAPSRVPEVNSREVPKWMQGADVDAVIAGFASSASVALRAGCDGVEINAGQFSLIRQFCSGLTNHRQDGWPAGTRFALDVLGAVRSAAGTEGVVGLRLSCDELAPWAGITPEEAVGLAVELCAEVDYLVVVRGSIYSAGATRPDGHTPTGFNLELCRQVRAGVRAAHGDRVAVVAQGSVVDVDQAEWAIVDGVADVVEMTRAQIADAELAAKVTRGEANRVRPCVLCNQNCQVRDNRNPIVSCVADPRSGHELEDPDPEIGRSVEPRRVVVIGGGPAGLEAARVCAGRGHRVTLVDGPGPENATTSGDPAAGGMVRVSARGPGRERLSLLVAWLRDECCSVGVQMVAGRLVEGQVVAGEAERAGLADPDVIIVATGSIPGERAFSVGDGASVVTAASVLAGADLPPGPVLVWDPIGGPIGVSVAEHLVGRGVEVHLATQDQIVGNELARSGDLGPANARLQGAGVVLHRRSLLRRVDADGAELEDRFTATRRRVSVSAVVDAGHRLPAPGPSLGGFANPVTGLLSAEVVTVGDAVAPRTIYEAVLEGRRAALAV